VHWVATDRTEEPGELERGVAVHTGPDSFAGGGDVVDLPSGRIDAGVDATEERDEGGSSRLEVGGITEPECGQSRTEHHLVQVGFAQSEAAVAPEVGHPVGDGIVGDRAAVQLGSEIGESAAHHLSGQFVHPAEVGIDDHRRRAQLAGQPPSRHGALSGQQLRGGVDDLFAQMRVGGPGRHARQYIHNTVIDIGT
jgi:hypothetical protein